MCLNDTGFCKSGNHAQAELYLPLAMNTAASLPSSEQELEFRNMTPR